jgi:hypothetical protein
MRKSTIKNYILTVLVAVSFIVASSLFAYDFAKYEVTPEGTESLTLDLSEVDEISTLFADINARYVRVRVIGTAVGYAYNANHTKYIQKEGVFTQQGSGTVIAPGSILTCAHVVVPQGIEIAEGHSSTRVGRVIKVTSTIVLLYDYKDTPVIGTIGYVDVASDLAIVHYNHKENSWFNPIEIPMEFGVEDLYENTLVCAVLHKRDAFGSMESDVHIRYGKIKYAYPYAPNPRIVAWLNPLDITMDLFVEGGDSGSALYAFRNGKPVLIGVVRAMYWGQLHYFSYASLIGGIQRYIESISDDTIVPVDLNTLL